MPFERRDAEQLLADTPWFVAFDGLDEVPAVSNRSEVLDAVRRFLMEARAKDADLLAIATTRPQGYESEFAPANFNHMTLIPLSSDEALKYAAKFVEAKYEGETDRRERIMRRLETAAREEATARLMESPLQVTIMAALVDLVGNPPRERYPLFNRYYEVVYQREQERGLKLSDVLAHHRVGIEILHDRIGLLLQIEAESAGSTQSKISRERLEGLVHDYLVAEGFEGRLLERTKADFMDVALHRLVFIVPVEDERYGFEVRSLQEFSAARALMRGEYTKVKERLFTIAPVPYWRNTTLFAVGRAFSEQDEQQSDMVTHMCRELNDTENDIVLFRTLAGSRLALDISEDYVVEWRPKYRRFFFQTAFELLALPDTRIASRLAKLCTEDDEERYKSAILTIAGNTNGELKISLYVLLAEISQRGDCPWAFELLQRIWPATINDERRILENIAKLLEWNPWTAEMVTRVARESSIGWVTEHLADIIPVKWMKDARVIGRHRRHETIGLNINGQETSFRFYIDRPLPLDMLDRIKQANPTHVEWMPFILCRDFILSPSAETLADALESVAQDERFSPKKFYYFGLPWQLAIFLNQVESKEDLLRHSQRARRGEFGSATDWEAAQTRWLSKGFSVDDLRVFTDAVWPFTAEIGQRGIQQLGSFGVTHVDADEENQQQDRFDEVFYVLVELFKDPNLTLWRKAFSRYALHVASYLPQPKLVNIGLDTLTALVGSAVALVRPATVLSLIEPGLNWLKIIDELDFIGSRISTLVGYEHEEIVRMAGIQRAIGSLVPLVGSGKMIQEGILRFIAALTIKGAKPVISGPIDYSALSPQGRIAVITIQLLTPNLCVPADILAQRIEELWAHANPNLPMGTPEMPAVVRKLLGMSMLSDYAIDVLNRLYPRPVIGIHIKQRIIDSFHSQLQYRTSRLNDPNRKSELALALS